MRVIWDASADVRVRIVKRNLRLLDGGCQSAAIGRDWYVPQFAHWREALDYGDRCWSKILSNWSAVREDWLRIYDGVLRSRRVTVPSEPAW